MKKIKAAMLGCGKIGMFHMSNITAHIPECEILYAYDPFLDEKKISKIYAMGIATATDSLDKVFNDSDLDAVLICSPSDTHADLMIKAADKKLHIFCEKPIDHDIAKIHEAISAVKESGVKFQIGFVRRFDHNHREIHKNVKKGLIGEPHILKVSSRDPFVPSYDYIKHSGGIFFDQMIHDFDIIRYLCGYEAIEVHAMGSVLIDPEVGNLGDVDTAMVMIKFENGAIGVIDNSRKAVYGYDQRTEVFGSKGCMFTDNDSSHEVTTYLRDETKRSLIPHYNEIRYKQAFIDEIKEFTHCIISDTNPIVSAFDGLQSVLLAKAATLSQQENRPVAISEIK